jgi:hypothetical protein
MCFKTGFLQFEKRFVERPGEEDVEQILVDESQAKNAAAEPEPVEVVVNEGGNGRNLEPMLAFCKYCRRKSSRNNSF